MLSILALIVVVLAGLYLVGLAGVSLLMPARASGFLLGFVGSATLHYLELLLRLLVGGAFLLRAPHMPFPDLFALFGWVLILTTAGLFLVPWQWHRRFANKAVPYAVRNLKLVAVSSLAAGGFVLGAASYGAAN